MGGQVAYGEISGQKTMEWNEESLQSGVNIIVLICAEGQFILFLTSDFTD